MSPVDKCVRRRRTGAVKKPVLFGVILVIALLGLLLYSSMNTAQHRVEVCMDFQGRRACRIASGASEEYALRAAITNACAQIASGVTETRGCESTTPASVTRLK
jgi:hypothetical protein